MTKALLSQKPARAWLSAVAARRETLWRARKSRRGATGYREQDPAGRSNAVLDGRAGRPEEHEEKKISFVKDDWTREEVRAVLDEAKNRGTILRPIIEKFVPEGAPVKFSSIPAARYKELVEELNI